MRNTSLQKFRKSSQSSVADNGKTTSVELGEWSDASGSGQGSQRSSTASGGETSVTANATTSSPGKRPPPAPPGDAEEAAGDLGDDFSNEMLAWYDSNAERTSAMKANHGGSRSKPAASNKPATLV